MTSTWVNSDNSTASNSHLLSKKPPNALRQAERQFQSSNRWNIMSVVNAMVRA